MNDRGRYPISGNNYYLAFENQFSIVFTQEVGAFGFFGIDVGDFGGRMFLTFLGASSTDLNVRHMVGQGGDTGGSRFFFGYINPSNPFLQVSFGTRGGSGTGDRFAFDDMTVAFASEFADFNGPGTGPDPTVIPEPATVFLLATGLIVIGGVSTIRRRRGG